MERLDEYAFIAEKLEVDLDACTANWLSVLWTCKQTRPVRPSCKNYKTQDQTSRIWLVIRNGIHQYKALPHPKPFHITDTVSCLLPPPCLL